MKYLKKEEKQAKRQITNSIALKNARRPSYIFHHSISFVYLVAVGCRGTRSKLTYCFTLGLQLLSKAKGGWSEARKPTQQTSVPRLLQAYMIRTNGGRR